MGTGLVSFDREWDEDDYAGLRILTPPLMEPEDGQISGATNGETEAAGRESWIPKGGIFPKQLDWEVWCSATN